MSRETRAQQIIITPGSIDTKINAFIKLIYILFLYFHKMHAL